MRRLILRPGAIGDFIVSLPAMEFLKADYTEVWTTEVNRPLARFADRSDSLVASGIDALKLSGGVLDRFAAFDSIESWYGTNRPEFVEAMREFPARFHKALPDGLQHAVDFYLHQVGARPGGIPSLPMQRRDEGFAVIHPFSGSERKNWPLVKFGELSSLLGMPFEWCAGPEDDLPGARCFDNLWELAQWIARARLYIGNDSGISHLAAAVGVPVIVLFGPTDPAVWSPRGRKVKVIPSKDGTMESISVRDVLLAVNAER